MKILFVVANGRNTSDLKLRQELRDVGDEIQRSPHAKHIEIRAALAARPMDLSRQLTSFVPDIVHFSGHGVRGRRLMGLTKDPSREFDAGTDSSKEPYSEGDILLEDEDGHAHSISASKLANLLEGTRAPRCVVLNACHTSETARKLAEHVDQVIGMNQAILDQSAITFAQGFYQRLAHGWPIHEAFDKATAMLDDETCELYCRWRVRLANLLATHYKPRELRMLISYQLHGASVNAVLGYEQDHQRNAIQVVDWIADKNCASEPFFHNLAKEPYEQLQAEVEDIAASWRRATKQNSWFPSIPEPKSSRSGGKVFTPAAPRVTPGILKDPTPPPPKVKIQTKLRDSSPELHTHTSIVLDRIEQWQTLVQFCKEKRPTHRVIVLYGSSEQNVELFMRRVKTYLAPAARQEHEIIKVTQVDGLTTARTCDEWKRCIRRAIPLTHGNMHEAMKQLAAKNPILMLFAHSNGRPLTASDDTTALAGLTQAIREIDKDLVYDFAQYKHSIRIVIPFEGNANRGPVAPPIKLLPIQKFHVTELPELVFPPWEPDVSKFIRETHPRADERILEKCKTIHTEIARTDRSLKRLSDRIDETMHEWQQRAHDF